MCIRDRTKVRVITCDLDNLNAAAFYSKKEDQLPADFTNQNYILYNKTWVNNHANSEEFYFVLGHEFAHIINNHDSLRGYSTADPERRRAMELEADYAGGCFVAKKQGSQNAMEIFIKDARSIPNENYPPVEKSLEKATAGFARCRQGTVPSPLAGIDVVYFKKDGDGGKVENTLGRNNIEFDPREGEYGEVSDYITCTSDVEAKDIKLLALLLYDAGIPLKGISRHSNTNLSHRLQIESGWDAEQAKDYRPLTKQEIEGLTDCPEILKRRNAREITFRNECSVADPFVVVRFFDSDAQEWRMRRLPPIHYDRERTVTNNDGEKYKTDRSFYFYAEAEPLKWPNAEGVDAEFELSDGSMKGFALVSHSRTRNLRCTQYE